MTEKRLREMAAVAARSNERSEIELPITEVRSLQWHEWQLRAFANARLAEMLFDCPRVFMVKGRGHFDAWTTNSSDLDETPTHTALLVRIEEIK